MVFFRIFRRSFSEIFKNIRCEIPGNLRIYLGDLIFSVQISEILKQIIKVGEFWAIIARNKQTFENKIAKMRKCSMLDEI